MKKLQFFFIFILLLSLVSCNNNDSKKYNRENKESTSIKKETEIDYSNITELDMPKDNIYLYIDGTKLDIKSPIYINKNRYYLCLNEIIKLLNGDVKKEEDILKFTINNNNYCINITSNTVTINNNTCTIKPLSTKDNKIYYIDFCDLAKIFDLYTNWNKDTKTIYCKTNANNIDNIKQKEKNTEENSNSDNNKELNDEFEEMYRKTFGITISNLENKVEEPKEEYKNSENEIKIEELKEVSDLSQSKINNQVKYKFIGIAFSNYIIIEIESDLYILDQQLANERILYEVIKKNYYNENEKDSQMMLLPDIITLNHKQMDIARDNMMLFKKAGFEVEEFGDNTIKLSGVPSICIELDTKELFLESLEAINTVARTAKKEIEEKFIATIAKKVAMKSKKSTTFEEVDCLMKKLLVLDNPFLGPQNKSIAFKLSEHELEKKFSKQQGGL